MSDVSSQGPVPDLSVRVAPDASPFASAWYAAEVAVGEPRAALAIDLDIDVCVIGAGLAGLTAAREIARRGWSVVILEAGTVGAAVSGRNTGFVLPGFGEDVGKIVERIGEQRARELWSLSEGGVAYMRRTIGEIGLQNTDTAPGWLHVTKTGRDEDMAALAARVRGFGSRAEYWPRAKVRAELPTDRYFGAVHFPDAFSINPLAYTLALAHAVEAMGVRIFERTPAVSIDPAGVRKRINTPSARVRASHVVLCGNVELGGLIPRLSATLIPVTSYVMVTEPIGALRETIRYRGAISDGERADSHYRIVGGERLMWSGRATTQPRDARRYARALTRDITRVFPQLGEVKPAHIWSGTLGLPIHRMPQIGEIARGVWVASGFGGHGLNTTAMAGDLIARGMTERDETWRLFAPYELVWAGGGFGRAVMSAILTGRRPFEAAQGALARYQERATARRARKKAERAARLETQRAEQAAALRAAAYQDAARTVVATTAAAVEPPQKDETPSESRVEPALTPQPDQVEAVPSAPVVAAKSESAKSESTKRDKVPAAAAAPDEAPVKATDNAPVPAKKPRSRKTGTSPPRKRARKKPKDD